MLKGFVMYWAMAAAGASLTSCGDSAAGGGKPTEAEMKSNAKRDASALAAAMVAADWNTTIKYMPRRLVDMMGGDEGIKKTFLKGTAEMDSQGFGFHSSTVGEPEQLQEIDGLHVLKVPQRTEMKAPGGRLVSNGWLLGVSGNSGRDWVFIDMVKLSNETLPKIYPEFSGRITFPEKKPPVFEKD